MIRGTTTLIAHFGDPIAPVKSPMIYNPYFESAGIDAVVVPMGVRSADYPAALKAVFQFTNIRGALVTMPHKVATVGLVQECTTAVRIAGSCNAVLRRPDGSLLGDLFDGAGFVRSVGAQGCTPRRRPLSGSRHRRCRLGYCGGAGGQRPCGHIALRRARARRRGAGVEHCASTIRRSTCARGPTTPRASTLSLTQPRWA